MRQLLVVAVTLGVGIPAARAQAPAGPAPIADPASDPTKDPGFVTMDRMDSTSRAGLDFAYVPENNSITAMRFDIHGQYQIPATQFGIYASIPIAYASGNNNQSTSDLLDSEIGGMWSSHATEVSPGTYLAGIVRAGITLPFGSTDISRAVAGLLGSSARFNDYYMAIPDAGSLRLSVSPVLRQGQVFVRADLGADLNVTHENGDNVPNAFRLNIGAGIELGQLALMVESVNLILSGNNGATVDVGSISARYRTSQVQLYGAITAPLDHDSNQLIDSVVATLGVEATLQ